MVKSNRQIIKSALIYGVVTLLLVVCIGTFWISLYYEKITSEEENEYKDLSSMYSSDNGNNNEEANNDPELEEPPQEEPEEEKPQSIFKLVDITFNGFSMGDPTVPIIKLVEKKDPATDSAVPMSVITPSIEEPVETPTPAPKKEQKDSEPTITYAPYSGGMGIDFASLSDINKDIRGWMRIDGMNIDYPVVQGDDNSYYLSHSFKKANSSSGCLFIDYTNEVDASKDQNIVVYGHNMSRSKGTMFSKLLNYYEESHYKQHPVIQFDMCNGGGQWQVFAAFMFDVNNINSFNYTQHNFGNATEFDAFIAKAKSLCKYNTGVNVSYGDHIITLSTCDRQTYGKTGRCVVMAKYVGGSIFNKFHSQKARND